MTPEKKIDPEAKQNVLDWYDKWLRCKDSLDSNQGSDQVSQDVLEQEVRAVLCMLRLALDGAGGRCSFMKKFGESVELFVNNEGWVIAHRKDASSEILEVLEA